MFETLKRLYDAGRLDSAGLDRAVKIGWITPAQAQEIQGVVK
ncbi:MAG: XkdX family protein [Pseudoflavonifractor sp.]